MKCCWQRGYRRAVITRALALGLPKRGGQVTDEMIDVLRRDGSY
jgi:hypothetical protein